MRFSSSIFAVLVVVAQVALAQVTFNCNNLADGAVIRLHPCFQNTLSLAVCNAGACGTDPAAIGQATLRPLTGADLSYGEWRIVASGDGLPAGHVRLASEAPGMASTFLAVEAKDQTFVNNAFGRQSQVASYLDSPAQGQWRWDLRPEAWPCRVLLRNAHASRKLGVIINGGPATTNSMSRPVAIYQDGTALTEETWEVEFVRMGAATVNGAAVAAAIMPPPAAIVPPPVVVPAAVGYDVNPPPAPAAGYNVGPPTGPVY